MDLLQSMAFLIEYPPLALVPAMLFVCLFAVSNARLIFVSAMSWLAYVPYEYGMKLRLLCSGECNIRVDLLAIYPLLIALSVAGLVVFTLRTRKRNHTGLRSQDAKARLGGQEDKVFNRSSAPLAPPTDVAGQTD